MAKTIGIIAIKGGVGKTTISASLASDLANHHGKKVLLIDANYSSPNLSSHMNIDSPVKTIQDVLSGKASIISAIHNRYGVDVIPGDYLFRSGLNPLKLKSRIASVSDKYDFVILDASPNLNDEMLSTILASDNLFVVTTPDEPTLACSIRAAIAAKEKGKPISGVIINKIRDPEFEIAIEDIEKATGLPVIARIPDEKHNTRALFTGIPVSIYNKNSKFAKEINKIGAALTNTPEKKSILEKIFSFNFSKERVNRQVLRESLYDSVFKEEN